MAYGVLEALAETPIQWESREKRLLDEVDIIASVSGGSLTAAYYALHRDRIFHEFESQVLGLDLASDTFWRILSPRGLWRQTSRRLGRADLLQEVLDERIFKGKTYADLPRSRPMIFINATEMKLRERFEFSQDQFDRLCSDIGSLPIARAVAASMAAPIVLSPVTLWNFQPSCPWRPLAPQ
ncbi:MAG: patatin-like phospholipase family protein, partial [Noviherbaspirillum sp.]